MNFGNYQSWTFNRLDASVIQQNQGVQNLSSQLMNANLVTLGTEGDGSN